MDSRISFSFLNMLLFLVLTDWSLWIWWKSYLPAAVSGSRSVLEEGQWTNTVLYRQWRRHHVVLQQHGTWEIVELQSYLPGMTYWTSEEEQEDSLRRLLKDKFVVIVIGGRGNWTKAQEKFKVAQGPIWSPNKSKGYTCITFLEQWRKFLEETP